MVDSVGGVAGQNYIHQSIQIPNDQASEIQLENNVLARQKKVRCRS